MSWGCWIPLKIVLDLEPNASFVAPERVVKAGRILREVDEALELCWFWLRKRRSKKSAVSATKKAQAIKVKIEKQDLGRQRPGESGRRDSK
jgi:hypothetical protein